jgi:hypothetical protein
METARIGYGEPMRSQADGAGEPNLVAPEELDIAKSLIPSGDVLTAAHLL